MHIPSYLIFLISLTAVANAAGVSPVSPARPPSAPSLPRPASPLRPDPQVPGSPDQPDDGDDPGPTGLPAALRPGNSSATASASPTSCGWRQISNSNGSCTGSMTTAATATATYGGYVPSSDVPAQAVGRNERTMGGVVSSAGSVSEVKGANRVTRLLSQLS